MKNFINVQASEVFNLNNKPPKPTKKKDRQLMMFAEPFGDFDKDRVMNIFDCQPFNKMFQDVKPSKLMKARIERLPIFLTARPIQYNRPERIRKIYHISEKQIPKQTKQAVYGLFKKYPETIGEIERKKPRAIVFTSGGIKSEDALSGFAQISEKGKAREDLPEGSGFAVIQLEHESGKMVSDASREETAKTTIHELEHIRQQYSAEKYPKLAQRYKRGRYTQRLEEVLAREKEMRLERARKDIRAKRFEKQIEQLPERIKKYKRFKKAMGRLKYFKKRIKEKSEAGFRKIFTEEEGGNNAQEKEKKIERNAN